jgi:hypothetical protein
VQTFAAEFRAGRLTHNLQQTLRVNEVIKKGLTSWKKLEAAKRVLPPQRQKKSTVKWLLGRAI